jgi:hypothetical protein
MLLVNKRDEIKIISEAYFNKMRELLVGKVTASRLVDDKGKLVFFLAGYSYEQREELFDAIDRLAGVERARPAGPTVRAAPAAVHFDALTVHPETIEFALSTPWLHDAGEMHEANFHFAAAGLLVEMQDGTLARAPTANGRVMYTVTLPRADGEASALDAADGRWETAEFAPLPVLSVAAA